MEDSPKAGTEVTISLDRVETAAAEGSLPERFISVSSESKTMPASGTMWFDLHPTQTWDGRTRYSVSWRNPEGGGAYNNSFIMPDHPVTLRQAILHPAIIPPSGTGTGGDGGSTYYYSPSAPAGGSDDDWWFDTSTDPWTAHVRNTGAWHQVGGGAADDSLNDQLAEIRSDLSGLDAFEDAFVIRRALGRADVRVAVAQAQSTTAIDLPADGLAAKLEVSATINNRLYKHSFDITDLRALPDAGNDPLNDVAQQPPGAPTTPNALRFQWDPTDSDSSLFVGHKSGKLVFSLGNIADIAWDVADRRIRVVLNFQDLGNTPAGDVPGSRNIETNAAGEVTYGALIKRITDLQGFPSVITDGQAFVGGPGNTVIQAALPSSGGGGGGTPASKNIWEATGNVSLAEAAHAQNAAQQLAIAAGTIDAGSGMSISSNRLNIAAGTAERIYAIDLTIEAEGRTFGTTPSSTGNRTGGSRLFTEFFAMKNGVEMPGTRQSAFFWYGPWAPNPQHEGVHIDAVCEGGDYLTFHLVRVNAIGTGGEVARWRVNSSGSTLHVDSWDIEGGTGGGGGGGKFTDGSDTPSAIPPNERYLRSTQAGGHLEFAPEGSLIEETPQRLSALPAAPKAGQWFTAATSFGSQLGATVNVTVDNTRNGAQEMIAGPAELVDTLTTPITVEVDYADGEAVPLKLSAADIARIRALPDTPTNVPPPDNSPITTFPPGNKIDFPIRTYDGVILATLFLGHRGNRIWFAFQEDLGGTATVKFFTGLNATAGETYRYVDGRWENVIHWINAIRNDAEKADIIATVIPSVLQANSADRIPTGKLVRTMTAAEFAAETDQSGIISIPVT